MIKDFLINKTSKEKSQIKSLEIVKLNHRGIFNSIQYGTRIEIIGEVKTIEINGQHGIELFARAWKDGKQLGFGKDGSVEIERFRIFNPPILVDDPNGTIIQEWTDEITKELKQRKLREDPLEAIKQVIAHNAKLIGKENTQIVIGKVGNTTSTFYSLVGDGGVQYWNTQSWTISHDAANGRDGGGDGFNYTDPTYSSMWWASGSNFQILRAFFPFDTSALGDLDTIDSATLSLNAIKYNATVDMSMVQASQASVTTLANSDYSQISTTKIATDKSNSVWASQGYQEWALNATGIAYINKTGYTKIGIRTLNDVTNTEPSPSTGAGLSTIYTSEQGGAGTTQDPKLVVVHSVASTFTPSVMIF